MQHLPSGGRGIPHTVLVPRASARTTLRRQIGMRSVMTRFWRDESGQGLVEYALILFLVSIVVIVALTTLGKKTNNVLNNVSKALNA